MSDSVNIGSQALLVSLSFGLPRQGRQLPKVAAEIEQQNHAQAGVTKASCHYFMQKHGKETIDALANLKAYFGAWKKEHERLARIPWAGTVRLLPAALVPQYLEMRNQFEAGAPAKVDEFMEVFPDWLTTAQHRMGALYSAEDFPSAAESRERITWETTLMPLPDEEGWRRVALINADHVAEEAQRMNTAVTQAREAGRRETWGELIGHFDHIVKTLSADRPRIFETLIGNLNSILDLVPAYNALFNDGDLLRCAAEAKELLGSVTADDLRADPALRQQTVRNAEQLIANFGMFGRRLA